MLRSTHPTPTTILQKPTCAKTLQPLSYGPVFAKQNRLPIDHQLLILLCVKLAFPKYELRRYFHKIFAYMYQRPLIKKTKGTCVCLFEGALMFLPYEHSSAISTEASTTGRRSFFGTRACQYCAGVIHRPVPWQ